MNLHEYTDDKAMYTFLSRVFLPFGWTQIVTKNSDADEYRDLIEAYKADYYQIKRPSPPDRPKNISAIVSEMSSLLHYIPHDVINGAVNSAIDAVSAVDPKQYISTVINSMFNSYEKLVAILYYAQFGDLDGFDLRSRGNNNVFMSTREEIDKILPFDCFSDAQRITFVNLAGTAYLSKYLTDRESIYRTDLLANGPKVRIVLVDPTSSAHVDATRYKMHPLKPANAVSIEDIVLKNVKIYEDLVNSGASYNVEMRFTDVSIPCSIVFAEYEDNSKNTIKVDIYLPSFAEYTQDGSGATILSDERFSDRKYRPSFVLRAYDKDTSVIYENYRLCAEEIWDHAKSYESVFPQSSEEKNDIQSANDMVSLYQSRNSQPLNDTHYFGTYYGYFYNSSNVGSLDTFTIKIDQNQAELNLKVTSKHEARGFKTKRLIGKPMHLKPDLILIDFQETDGDEFYTFAFNWIRYNPDENMFFRQGALLTQYRTSVLYPQIQSFIMLDHELPEDSLNMVAGQLKLCSDSNNNYIFIRKKDCKTIFKNSEEHTNWPLIDLLENHIAVRHECLYIEETTIRCELLNLDIPEASVERIICEIKAKSLNPNVIQYSDNNITADFFRSLS